MYTQSTLAQALNTSDRTLSRHREALEAKYGIAIAEKQGRTLFYLDAFLSLISSSIAGQALPESLDDWGYPEFTPVGTETPEAKREALISQLPSAIFEPIEAEIVEPESSTSALVAFDSTTRKLAPSTSHGEGFNLRAQSLDLSALDNSKAQSLDLLAQLQAVTEAAVLQNAEATGQALVALWSEKVLGTVALGKAQATKDLMQNL